MSAQRNVPSLGDRARLCKAELNISRLQLAVIALCFTVAFLSFNARTLRFEIADLRASVSADAKGGAQ